MATLYRISGIGLGIFSKEHGQIFAGSNRTESGDDRAINFTRVTLVGSVEMVVEVLGILVRCQERDNSPWSCQERDNSPLDMPRA